jgi:hypothetical protein
MEGEICKGFMMSFHWVRCVQGPWGRGRPARMVSTWPIPQSCGRDARGPRRHLLCSFSTICGLPGLGVQPSDVAAGGDP